MDKKILSIIVGIVIVVSVIGISLSQFDSTPNVTLNKNEKIGLVINTPITSVSLKQLDDIYQEASSTGIGRSNVYMFWNIIEPTKGEFDWSQSYILISLNKKIIKKLPFIFQ